MPETSYAMCGDLSLAYQVFGDGPVELIIVEPFVSHLELAWTLPQFKAFADQLATFCRVALFDKAGVGMSDPVPNVRSVDGRAAEIEAVMDAVGFEKAALFALSEGAARSARHLATAGGRPTGRARERPRRHWRQCLPPALAPRCAGRTAPWKPWPGGHRGSCAGWPA